MNEYGVVVKVVVMLGKIVLILSINPTKMQVKTKFVTRFLAAILQLKSADSNVDSIQNNLSFTLKLISSPLKSLIFR